MSFNRYWIAPSTESFSDSNFWSTNSGGPGGASVPTEVNKIIFDGNGLGNCKLDQWVSVKDWYVFPTYTGKILQNNQNVTVENDAILMGGKFSGDTGNIKIGHNFSLEGTDFISTSDVLYIWGEFSCNKHTYFKKNNGTVVLYANNQIFNPNNATFHNLVFNMEPIEVDATTFDTTSKYQTISSDSFINNELTLSGGYLKNSSGIIHVRNNAVCNKEFGSFIKDHNALVMFDSTSHQELVTYGGLFPNIYVDKRDSSEQIKCYGTTPVYVNLDFNIMDGVFNSHGLDIIVGFNFIPKHGPQPGPTPPPVPGCGGYGCGGYGCGCGCGCGDEFKDSSVSVPAGIISVSTQVSTPFHIDPILCMLPAYLGSVGGEELKAGPYDTLIIGTVTGIVLYDNKKFTTVYTTPGSLGVNNIVFTGDKWVAELNDPYNDSHGMFIHSYDGKNWSFLSTPSFFHINLFCDPSNGLLLVVDTGPGDIDVAQVRVSSDGGVTWSSKVGPVFYNHFSLSNFVYDGTKYFIAAGCNTYHSPSSIPAIYSSSDGINWSISKQPSFLPGHGAVSCEFGRIQAGNGYILVDFFYYDMTYYTGYSSFYRSGNSGGFWEDLDPTKSVTNFSNNLFINDGHWSPISDTTIGYSVNGATWISSTFPLEDMWFEDSFIFSTSPLCYIFSSYFYGGSEFSEGEVGPGGYRGMLYKSDDLNNWKLISRGSHWIDL